jgi:hypothetical protein
VGTKEGRHVGRFVGWLNVGIEVGRRGTKVGSWVGDLIIGGEVG